MKSQLFGVFYKNRDKWTGPAHEELFTLGDICRNSGLGKQASIFDHIRAFLKQCRKQKRKPVELRRQVWATF
jgi:hypothetical protein